MVNLESLKIAHEELLREGYLTMSSIVEDAELEIKTLRAENEKLKEMCSELETSAIDDLRQKLEASEAALSDVKNQYMKS